MPKPTASVVGVVGRGVDGLDFVLGVRGSGFSLQDFSLFALILCTRDGMSFELRENL